MVTQKLKLIIENYDIKSDYTFSIFNKWLTEVECEGKIFSAMDVMNFENFETIQNIEKQFLALLVNINNLYEIQIVNIDLARIIRQEVVFNNLYRLVANYINRVEETILYISKLEIIMVLSHDFNIYLYQVGEKTPILFKEIFSIHKFYDLS